MILGWLGFLLPFRIILCSEGAVLFRITLDMRFKAYNQYTASWRDVVALTGKWGLKGQVQTPN